MSSKDFHIEIDGHASSSTHSVQQNWRKRYRDQILSKFIPPESSLSVETLALSLCPLKFTDPIKEAEFAKSISLQQGIRVSLSGLILVTSLVFGSILQHFTEDVIYHFDIQFIINLIVIVLGCLLTVSPLIPVLKDNLEFVLYTVVLMAESLYIVSHAMAHDYYETRHQMLFTPPAFLFVIYVLVTVFIFVQCRFRFSFWVVLGSYFANRVTQIVTARDLVEVIGSFHVILHGMLTLSIAAFGRFFYEVMLRIKFGVHLRDKEIIEELNRRLIPASSNKNRSELEDALMIMKKAKNMCFSVTEGDSHSESYLKQTAHLLQQSLDRLAASQDIYAVQMTSFDTDANDYMEYLPRRLCRQTSSIAPYGGLSSIIEFDETSVGGTEAVKASVSSKLVSHKYNPKQWDFDILTLSRFSGVEILTKVGFELLAVHCQAIGASDSSLLNFLSLIDSYYNANPYHSSAHGATVAHSVDYFIRCLKLSDSELFGPLEHTTALVAALSHDCGHPGRSNSFLINSNVSLAILYNDKSVLENFHCSITFMTLSRDDCQIFKAVNRENYNLVRSRIISMILCTDTAEHFQFLSRLRVRRESTDFDFFNKQNDLCLVLDTCIKTADIGHTMFPWTTHLEWSFRVAEEFYQQGYEEKLQGRTILAMYDRGNHPFFAKSQKNFIDYIAEPLFVQLASLLRRSTSTENDLYSPEFMIQLKKNKIQWTTLMNAGAVLDIPQHISEIETNSQSFIRSMRKLLLKMLISN